MTPWTSHRRRFAALWVDATLSLTAKPARTLGMMAGIMLAAASATGAMVVADTQQTQIDRRFDLQRSSAVVIQAQSAPEGFDPSAIAAIADLEPVNEAGELSIWSEAMATTVNRWSPEVTAPLLVADEGGLAVGAENVTGAAPHNLSLDQPLVWVGHNLAEHLRLASTQSPQVLLIHRRPFTVAGIVTARPGFEYIDTSLILGRRTAVALVPAGRTVRMVATIRPGSAQAVAEYALARLDETKTLDLVDVTPPDGEQLLANVAGDLRLIGLALGGLVGIIGTVAVANTMSMSVTQRTRELGLRSAMGWTPGRIRALILVESGMAGLYAAIVGCATGCAAALIWAGCQGWQPIISRTLPVAVIGAGVCAAVIGGVLPAHRASRITPLAAMRS